MLLALADMHNGYYVFMRIIVCIACSIVAYGSYKRNDSVNLSVIVFVEHLYMSWVRATLRGRLLVIKV